MHYGDGSAVGFWIFKEHANDVIPSRLACASPHCSPWLDPGTVGRPYLGDLVAPIFVFAIIAARSPRLLYYIENALPDGKAGLEGYKSHHSLLQSYSGNRVPPVSPRLSQSIGSSTSQATRARPCPTPKRKKPPELTPGPRLTSPGRNHDTLAPISSSISNLSPLSCTSTSFLFKRE
jgi:hypothetical protein